MEMREKLARLAEGGKYDVCSCSCSRPASSSFSGVYRSFTPDGRSLSLFRVLLTNRCSGDCSYCPNACTRRIKRTELTVSEYIRVFLHFHRLRYVEGLFLSSGMVGDADTTMEKMCEIAECLRYKNRFRGYVHLKVLPGASRDMVCRASEVADRLSVNIEVPGESRFCGLSSTKDYRNDILRPMGWLADIQKKKGGMPAGHTTQFVVGASGESDAEILACAERLYEAFSLKRCYFSAFMPLIDTPLSRLARTPLLREHRLYQADFLLRQYGFSLKDIFFDGEDKLPLRHDPKFYFAMRRGELFPMDVNDASFDDLLKVPGIGPRSARRIIKARKSGFRFTTMAELRNVGVVMKRACAFIDMGERIQRRLCYESV